MRITTIINGKGGVGKTTTTHAMSTGLNKRGLSTLAVDYDPQGNLSLAFGADVSNHPTMYHVIVGEASFDEAIQHTTQGNIIAGNSSLSKMDTQYHGDTLLDGITRLKEELNRLSDQYDYIFIDNQPLIGGLLTMQSLVAANDLVVPLSADVFAVQGLVKLQEATERIKKIYNPNLMIDGLLLTKHNPRTVISGQMSENLSKWSSAFNSGVYKTFIREGVAVREAQLKKQSVFDYAPTSNPAQDYIEFINEYVDQGELKHAN